MLKTKLYKYYTNYLKYNTEFKCEVVLYRFIPHFANILAVKYRDENLITARRFKNKEQDHKICVFRLSTKDFGVAVETEERKFTCARFIYETKQDAVFAANFLCLKYKQMKWKEIKSENPFTCK